ncbi:alpha-ribazole phosphatase [Tenacibaculum sp. SZ-18]|uniref:alpha-ribazole phosphatase n=1 Tax=Tenacibaculum sp. SZ-18 TaxID=754423 RepID=UPI000C2D41CB|nr:alpha-ribazole phosphatase [Tenacibaculum sp. SZ-18]AUC15201.1 alpha-ribazole phosphatase [Tenacibaculum sp. SZ-18]
MEIILVRHTTPAIAKGICYGQADIDVENTFEEEVQEILTNLKSFNFDAIFSSPLQRCKKLAKRINDKIIFDQRLKELDFGNWDLKKWNDIPEEELNPWMENFVELAPPNGESYIDLHRRTTSFLDEISNKNYKEVLLVTHAGVIRSMWSYVNNIPLNKSFDLKLTYGETLCFNL